MADKWRLILLSFLMLFVELALIRWLGSNVVYLSYFSNFVLLGSFLGIGIGFLRTKSKVDLFRWAPLGLVFIIAFVLAFPVVIDRSGNDLLYFGARTGGLPSWIMLPVIFVAAAAIMTSIAQEVGRVFGRFDPLEAYRLDVLGSLCGIVAFSVLSFLGAPPVAWGAIVAALLLVLSLPSLRLIQVVAAIAIVVMLGVESRVPIFSWSPYYKVSVTTTPKFPGIRFLSVNGIPHQLILSKTLRKQYEPLYFTPYQRVRSNPLRNVLIVGAGSGGDVAIALAQGAKHVDAVEIDPRIYQIGRDLHPDHPYQQSNVTIHIDDGRAFLQRTHNTYDLILFALPDSLVLVSGQSSLRLESFLFTAEAMQAAREHLNPGGAFAMYNYYREPWLIDRFARTLDATFGHPPCIDALGGSDRFAVLTIGREAKGVACRTTWVPGTAEIPAPATDDRPFPYLRTPSIPGFYLIALGAILLLSLVLIRATAGPLTEMRGYLDLFFMGAAFLLLETKNVVQFALLFGTTWFVNALVFAGILASVYAAVMVAQRVRFRNVPLLYAMLAFSLALAWAIEPECLLGLDVSLRFAAATSLGFAPVFLANLIFAERFRTAATSTVAFATNLLGAMVGGVLEYSSLVLGYRNLLVLIAIIYGLAFFAGRRHLVSNTSAILPNTVPVPD